MRKLKLSTWCFLIVFCLIGCLMVYQITINRKKDLQINEPGQFALIDLIPTRIQDGAVYQYETDGSWKNLGITQNAKQILSGENLCILNEDGSLYYDGAIELDLQTQRRIPLSAGYDVYMRKKVLAINKEEPFVWLGHSLDFVSLQILLQSGEILYESMSEYERYLLEEKPVMLAGAYVLTEKGNVYYQNRKERDEEVIVNFECIYDKGDIVTISSWPASDECLALRRNGTVFSWRKGKEKRTLDVENWNNVIAIEDGFYYGLGLTSKGTVLYADLGGENEENKKEFSTWTDIVQISIWGNYVAGLKKDGSCIIYKVL